MATVMTPEQHEESEDWLKTIDGGWDIRLADGTLVTTFAHLALYLGVINATDGELWRVVNEFLKRPVAKRMPTPLLREIVVAAGGDTQREAKHLPGQHDQQNHAGGRGGGGVDVVGGKDGAPFDLAASKQLAKDMGVPDYSVGRKAGSTGHQLTSDDDGFPQRAEVERNLFGNVEETGKVEDVPYVFRAVSEDDWHGVQKSGYMQSDARMNLAEGEGTVTVHDRLPVFYLPKDGEGRFVRIRVSREDGWRLDPVDGYIKTSERIPLERIDKVSKRIGQDDDGFSIYAGD